MGTHSDETPEKTAMTADHEINITGIPPNVQAIPPAPRISVGETVVFVNRTAGDIKILMASDEVLDDLKELQKLHVKPDEPSKVLVAQDNVGEHQYAAHCRYKDPDTKKWLGVFAIGASSPKIIIDR